METEVWSRTGTYPVYLISNYGNMKGRRGKKLLMRLDKKGYVRVTIGSDQKRTSVLVHRLVAIAFHPNPNNYPQVNHIDTNKQNNYFKNLEWCTNQMNHDHAKENGLLRPLPGEENGGSILTEKQVIEIREKSKNGHTRRMLAIEYGVAKTTIKDIKLRRSWAHI